MKRDMTLQPPATRSVMRGWLPWVLLGAAALIGCGIYVFITGQGELYNDLEQALLDVLHDVRQSPLSWLWVLLIFAGGGLVFFPVTVMTVASILVFGGFDGFFLSFMGASISSVIGYGIGRWLGRGRLERIFSAEAIAPVKHKIRRGGVLGVVLVRMVPIPFTLSNMLFGGMRLPFASFLLGSSLSMLPGKIMLALFGASLLQLLDNPEPVQMMQAGLILLAWGGVIAVTHKLVRRWERRRARESE
jgi:uncharacterized membrane protein YdjX (TVP38/TMEM64 family)